MRRFLAVFLTLVLASESAMASVVSLASGRRAPQPCLAIATQTLAPVGWCLGVGAGGAAPIFGRREASRLQRHTYRSAFWLGGSAAIAVQAYHEFHAWPSLLAFFLPSLLLHTVFLVRPFIQHGQEPYQNTDTYDENTRITFREMVVPRWLRDWSVAKPLEIANALIWGPIGYFENAPAENGVKMIDVYVNPLIGFFYRLEFSTNGAAYLRNAIAEQAVLRTRYPSYKAFRIANQRFWQRLLHPEILGAVLWDYEKNIQWPVRPPNALSDEPAPADRAARLIEQIRDRLPPRSKHDRRLSHQLEMVNTDHVRPKPEGYLDLVWRSEYILFRRRLDSARAIEKEAAAVRTQLEAAGIPLEASSDLREAQGYLEEQLSRIAPSGNNHLGERTETKRRLMDIKTLLITNSLFREEFGADQRRVLTEAVGVLRRAQQWASYEAVLRAAGQDVEWVRQRLGRGAFILPEDAKEVRIGSLDRLEREILDLIKRENGGSLTTELQDVRQLIVNRQLSLPQARRLLHGLRYRRVALDWETRPADDPSQNSWAEAVPLIARKMEDLESRYGKDIAHFVEKVTADIGRNLPIEGARDSNTYAHYVRESNHGLLHSLNVIDLSLSFLHETRQDTPGFFAGADVVSIERELIGVGLLHDLTSLGSEERRRNHHISGRAAAEEFLVRTGYEAAFIQSVKEGIFHHRGQQYPKPTTPVQWIFLDADEIATIADLERIASIATPNEKVFDKDLWSIYRRYIAQAEARFAGQGIFRHETTTADRYQYLLFTLIVRSDPAQYVTEPAKRWATEDYANRRNYILGKMAALYREQATAEKLKATGRKILSETEKADIELETQHAMDSIERQMLELEALVQKKQSARETLAKRYGDFRAVKTRVKSMIQEIQLEEGNFEKPAAREAFRLLNEVVSGKRPALTNNLAFTIGLGVFDQYLEDPAVDLAYELRTANDLIQTDPFKLAGFAFALQQAARDRITDLFEMVSLQSERFSERDINKLSLRLAADFLRMVDTAILPTGAARSVRDRLAGVRGHPASVLASA